MKVRRKPPPPPRISVGKTRVVIKIGWKFYRPDAGAWKVTVAREHILIVRRCSRFLKFAFISRAASLFNFSARFAVLARTAIRLGESGRLIKVNISRGIASIFFFFFVSEYPSFRRKSSNSFAFSNSQTFVLIFRCAMSVHYIIIMYVDKILHFRLRGDRFKCGNLRWDIVCSLPIISHRASCLRCFDESASLRSNAFRAQMLRKLLFSNRLLMLNSINSRLFTRFFG